MAAGCHGTYRTYGTNGKDLPRVEKAMAALAKSFSAEALGEKAYPLYESFRPEIPPGVRGWGVRGELDLSKMRALARAAE